MRVAEKYPGTLAYVDWCSIIRVHSGDKYLLSRYIKNVIILPKLFTPETALPNGNL